MQLALGGELSHGARPISIIGAIPSSLSSVGIHLGVYPTSQAGANVIGRGTPDTLIMMGVTYVGASPHMPVCRPRRRPTIFSSLQKETRSLP